MLPYRLVLTLLGMGQLISWAAFYYSFSSFVLPMQTSLGWDKATLMGAFSLGLAVWSLATYGAGAVIDAGYGRALMTGGSVLGGIGFLIWSQTSEPWMFYLAWCFIGCAMAMTLYEPAFTILTRRYPTRYRQGITTLTLIGGFASTVGFPAAAALLAVVDWRAAVLVIGIVLIAVIAPIHFLALRGGGELVPATAAASGEPAAETGFTVNEARRTAAFWLLTATFALYSFAAAALWAHVIPALAFKGLDTAESMAVLVWVGPAQVAGRLAFVTFGKRLRPHPLGMVILCGLPLSFGLFAFASTTAELIIFAVLFGAANGLVSIIRGSLLPEYFGRTSLGRIGGAMSAVALLARAIAPLSAAALLLLPMSYAGIMLVLAGLGVVAVVAFALARAPLR
ncbi:MFS transporter [Agaricicola taiwanensis]|uniref:MFS transporter n=1 Tax=Agaricicola taiwanensis TaxID=591372 RepID=UPI00166B239D|nr:MFS transporter [Agaricicola taiwanensis]